VNYWVITDCHFGHRFMEKCCGRPKDFEEIILQNLRRRVMRDDVLINLGDYIWPDRSRWNRQYMAATLGCRHWFVRGNHDWEPDQWYLDNGFDMVCEELKIKRFGKEILFSHKPMIDPETKIDIRFGPETTQLTIFRYDINIHGHFHNNDHRKYEPELVSIHNDRQHLLALENVNYEPIKLEKIINERFGT